MQFNRAIIKPPSSNTLTFIHIQAKKLHVSEKTIQKRFSSLPKKNKKIPVGSYVLHKNPITKEEKTGRIMHHTFDGRYIIRLFDSTFHFTTSGKTLSLIPKDNQITIKRSQTIRNFKRFLPI